MPSNLRAVSRGFVHGEVPLETLRQTARNEFTNRYMADQILKLIADWENSAHRNYAWSRDELRAKIEDLIPSIPEPSEKKRTGASAAAFMYESGLRGHLRRE